MNRPTNSDFRSRLTASLPVLLALAAPATQAFLGPLTDTGAVGLVAAPADTPATSESGNPFQMPERGDAGGAVLLAHAILVKANPGKDATITDAPEEVLLIFNESVGDEFLALAVIDESGKRVDHHDPKLDFTDRSHLRATVSKLSPGRYTVRYRVLSADGHVVSGKYFFNVQGK